MNGIVVGVDGSSGAANALKWAVQAGRRHQWPVTAVLTWSYLDQRHADPEAGFDPAYSDADARTALDAYLTAALGDEAAGVERMTVCDLAAPGLLGASKEADLVVVGARGLGGFKGLLIGSVSRSVLEHADVPVAVVHEPSGAAEVPPRVVVGTDGSPDSLTAVKWAASEAAACDGVLEVVHAWYVPAAGGFLDASPAYASDAISESAARTLAATVDALDAGALTHPIRSTLAHETPAAALLAAANGAEVVVVGRRGIGKLAGFLLGSVSNRVVHHAPCTVVVVPDHLG